MRAASYARVSTADQTCENQLIDLRRYCAARGWDATEYVDTGVCGAKDRRPALDALMADARRRKVDTVVVWRLDRFGRNLRHQITAIEELNAAGVSFVSLGENIDTASPTGRLLLGIMGSSFAEFERERIRERIHAGLARARGQRQKLGRKRQRIAASDPLGVARSQSVVRSTGISRSGTECGIGYSPPPIARRIRRPRQDARNSARLSEPRPELHFDTPRSPTASTRPWFLSTDQTLICQFCYPPKAGGVRLMTGVLYSSCPGIHSLPVMKVHSAWTNRYFGRSVPEMLRSSAIPESSVHASAICLPSAFTTETCAFGTRRWVRSSTAITLMR